MSHTAFRYWSILKFTHSYFACFCLQPINQAWVLIFLDKYSNTEHGRIIPDCIPNLCQVQNSTIGQGMGIRRANNTTASKHLMYEIPVNYMPFLNLIWVTSQYFHYRPGFPNGKPNRFMMVSVTTLKTSALENKASLMQRESLVSSRKKVCLISICIFNYAA